MNAQFVFFAVMFAGGLVTYPEILLKLFAVWILAVAIKLLW